jgi:hypothetical protein
MTEPRKELETAEYAGSRVERSNREVAELAGGEYKYGWSTDIDSDTFAKGLNEDVIRAISERKQEPEHYVFYPCYDWRWQDVWRAIHEHGWQLDVDVAQVLDLPAAAVLRYATAVNALIQQAYELPGE